MIFLFNPFDEKLPDLASLLECRQVPHLGYNHTEISDELIQLGADLGQAQLRLLGSQRLVLFMEGNVSRIFTGIVLVPIVVVTTLYSSGYDVPIVFGETRRLMVFYGKGLVVESITDALSNNPLGLGTGMGTGPARYVAPLGSRYLAESTYGKAINELGVLGMFAVLAIFSKRGLITWAIFAFSLTFTMPAIIQNYSPSDNVRELFLTGGGYWFAILCLYWTWVAALCSRVGLLRAIGIAGLAVVPAWMLLSQSINISAIHGLRVSLFWFGLVFVFLLACVTPAMSVQQPSNQLAMPPGNKIAKTAMS